MKFGLREIVFILVLLAVPIAAAFYLFKPRNTEIQKLQADNEMKQAKLRELADVRRRVDDIKLEIDKGKQAIAMIEAKLPSERDVEGMLQDVWNAAERNRLNLKSVKAQEPVPAANYMELPLDVVMAGSFNGFYQFLLDLEALERITRVHNMKLRRAGFSEGGGRNRRRGAGTTSFDGEVEPGSTIAEYTLSIYFDRQDAKSTKIAAESTS